MSLPPKKNYRPLSRYNASVVSDNSQPTYEDFMEAIKSAPKESPTFIFKTDSVKHVSTTFYLETESFIHFFEVNFSYTERE